MIPAPPGLTAIIDGITYGIGLATRRASPESLKRASVWDALWFRFLLVLANSMLALGVDALSLIPLVAVMILVDTLAYPVASHFVLSLMGLDARWRVFILAVTWVGNLRVLIAMIIILVLGNFGTGYLVILVAAMFWMLWATWSAAARSLGNRGMAGAGMVVLMMLLELVSATAILAFVEPRI